MGRNENRTHRDDLVGEHPFGDSGQVILLIVFLAVWIADSFIFRFSTFAAKYVSLFLRMPLGVIILLVSGYLAKGGMSAVFGEERQGPVLIHKGVFNMVRHPVYLGCILFYLGLLIFTLSAIAGFIWITVIVFYHYISKYEERLLLTEFGKEYEKYMKRVPMWIPRLK
jgi:protein-S-isoprenylcysteine O-methyltransferase Ste14